MPLPNFTKGYDLEKACTLFHLYVHGPYPAPVMFSRNLHECGNCGADAGWLLYSSPKMGRTEMIERVLWKGYDHAVW